MFFRTVVGLVVFTCSSVANAGAVVELVPDNPGPYFGAESVTVDIWLHSQEASDVELRTVEFDLSQSDSDITLDSTFQFDFSSLTSGADYWVYPELPRPGFHFAPDFITPPGYLLVLPAADPLHIGRIGLRLPSQPGTFRIDALNSQEPDLSTGGALFRLTTGTSWLAYDGDITGGVLDFVVIPEPGTLALLGIGAMALGHRARRRRFAPRVGRRCAAGPRGKLYTRCAAFVCMIGAGIVTEGTAMGQPVFVPSQKVTLGIDSGAVSTVIQSSEPVVVFSQIVSRPGVSWLRLHFESVELSGSIPAGNGSFVRVTSLADGAIQVLNADAISAWHNSSAYFNGDAVLLELLAWPNTGDNRVVVDGILEGVPEQVGGGGPEGPAQHECVADDRVSSDDPRSGRYLFAVDPCRGSGISGCTAWLFDNRPNSLLTAGHCCADSDFGNGEFAPIVEFNVPLSKEEKGTLLIIALGGSGR